MRRSAYVPSLALAGLLLAGCAASPTTADAPRPTGSTPAPAPTPTVDADDPSTWLVTDEGMGPFVLGTPIAEVLASADGFEEACGTAWSRDVGGPGESVWIASVDDALAYVESTVPDGPHTSEGIGVGSTTADVLAAFPDATVEVRNLAYLRSGNLYFGYASDVVYGEGETQYVDDGTPEEIVAVGTTDQDALLYEFCG